MLKATLKMYDSSTSIHSSCTSSISTTSNRRGDTFQKIDQIHQLNKTFKYLSIFTPFYNNETSDIEEPPFIKHTNPLLFATSQISTKSDVSYYTSSDDVLIKTNEWNDAILLSGLRELEPKQSHLILLTHKDAITDKKFKKKPRPKKTKVENKEPIKLKPSIKPSIIKSTEKPDEKPVEPEEELKEKQMDSLPSTPTESIRCTVSRLKVHANSDQYVSVMDESESETQGRDSDEPFMEIEILIEKCSKCRQKTTEPAEPAPIVVTKQTTFSMRPESFFLGPCVATICQKSVQEIGRYGPIYQSECGDKKTEIHVRTEGYPLKAAPFCCLSI